MIDCVDPEVCGVARHRNIENCKAAKAVEPLEVETAETENTASASVSIKTRGNLLAIKGKRNRRR